MYGILLRTGRIATLPVLSLSRAPFLGRPEFRFPTCSSLHSRPYHAARPSHNLLTTQHSTAQHSTAQRITSRYPREHIRVERLSNSIGNSLHICTSSLSQDRCSSKRTNTNILPTLLRYFLHIPIKTGKPCNYAVIGKQMRRGVPQFVKGG